jgi:hypothetical protein
MLFNQARKHAVTDIDWEIQRQTYVQQNQSLSAEFDRFKQAGTQPQQANIVDYTLRPATLGQPSGNSVVRLPPGYHILRVFSGRAWITYKGNDYLLKTGGEMVFENGSSNVVVSAMGNEVLNFQIAR